MAGEQSCGTFTRVHGETDALRERARAVVERVEQLEPAAAPSLPNAWLDRQRHRRAVAAGARHAFAFRSPMSARNLATLAATVAGNLYDLGEVTGLRLDRVRLPGGVSARALPLPRAGHRGHPRADRRGARGRWSARSSSRMSGCRPRTPRRWWRRCARRGSISSRMTRSARTRTTRRSRRAFRR